MNRTQSVPTPEGRFSRVSRSTANRLFAAFLLMTFSPAAALAQYPGGGPAPSYGSKGAVVGGVAAGAAVGAGLLYWKFHGQAKLDGCVTGDGDKLFVEKDNQTYSLTNQRKQSLKPGEHVELLGKKTKNAAGEPTFEVRKLSKEFGQCATTNAAEVRPQN